MKGWQLESYSGLSALTFKDDLKIPVIQKPDQVLVKIEASSVNPLDIIMCQGYGKTIFNFLRKQGGQMANLVSGEYLPLTLGRDFSGTVVDIGDEAKDDFKIGDQVWGANSPYGHQGSHAEMILVSASEVNT
jgi:NADPH:quinone reductase-like Zn-dependent oxidoreductase